jgi:hypothetical protein
MKAQDEEISVPEDLEAIDPGKLIDSVDVSRVRRPSGKKVSGQGKAPEGFSGGNFEGTEAALGALFPIVENTAVRRKGHPFDQGLGNPSVQEESSAATFKDQEVAFEGAHGQQAPVRRKAHEGVRGVPGPNVEGDIAQGIFPEECQAKGPPFSGPAHPDQKKAEH